MITEARRLRIAGLFIDVHSWRLKKTIKSAIILKNTYPMPKVDPAAVIGDALATAQAGGDIYDRLMAQIEPELTMEGLKTLPEKYKNETPEDAHKRGHRYKQAFEKYDRQFQAYVSNLQAAERQIEHGAVAAAEAAVQTDESGELANIQSKISSQ